MLIILLCIFYSVNAHLDIELGTTYYSLFAPWQGDSSSKIFDLKIQETVYNQDLTLVIKSLTGLKNPIIYISTTQNEPNQNSAEIKCESTGLDICQITSPKAATYHIAVYCEVFCRFSLKAVYQKQLQMTNDDDMEFKLVDSWTEIIKINVSQITDTFNSSPQTMEIQVRIRNFDILQESFKSFLNKGVLVPTTSENDYKGEDTYSGMQKFKINAVAIGDMYTLTVETQAGAIVEIQTRTYGVMRNIRLGDKIEDVLQEWEYSFYCLDLKNETKAKAFPRNYLNIQLLPYKGYAEMYVNFDKQPPFLNQFTWQLKDKVAIDLVITEEDVKKYNITGNQVFIVVVANQSNVTYELKSQLVDPNLMLLELNKPTTGELKNDKKIQYEFFIRGNILNTVSVTLKNIIGETDLVMKQCESIWTCKVSDDELLKRSEKVNYKAGSLFMYSDEPGNDIIVFDNQPGKCQQYGNTYQCYYAVLIHPGKDNNVDKLTYSISITAKIEMTNLRENTP